MDRSLQHRRWDCLGPGSGSRGRMTEGRALPSETLLRSWRKWSLVQSVSLLHKHIIYQTWQCRPTRNTHVLQVHTHTNYCIHLAQQQQKRKLRREYGLAKLCCLIADELSAHWHVGYVLSVQWALPQLLWQSRNSCLRMENGVAVEGSAGWGAEERLSYMSDPLFQTSTLLYLHNPWTVSNSLILGKMKTTCSKS